MLSGQKRALQKTAQLFPWRTIAVHYCAVIEGAGIWVWLTIFCVPGLFLLDRFWGTDLLKQTPSMTTLAAPAYLILRDPFLPQTIGKGKAKPRSEVLFAAAGALLLGLMMGRYVIADPMVFPDLRDKLLICSLSGRAGLFSLYGPHFWTIAGLFGYGFVVLAVTLLSIGKAGNGPFSLADGVSASLAAATCGQATFFGVGTAAWFACRYAIDAQIVSGIAVCIALPLMLRWSRQADWTVYRRRLFEPIWPTTIALLAVLVCGGHQVYLCAVFGLLPALAAVAALLTITLALARLNRYARRPFLRRRCEDWADEEACD